MYQRKDYRFREKKRELVKVLTETESIGKSFLSEGFKDCKNYQNDKHALAE